MNVLICDDSGFARKQLARALPADWDVTLHYAANGLEGIEQVLMGHGDLIFLDLTMPEMDGYGVLETLQREGLRNKVFVVSGDIQPEAYQRVMGLGALDFIKKPAAPETLSALLKQHELWQAKGAATAHDTRPAGQSVSDAGSLDTGIKISPEVRDVYQELANVSMGQAADLLAACSTPSWCCPFPTSTCWKCPSCTWPSRPPPTRILSPPSARASSAPVSPARR